MIGLYSAAPAFRKQFELCYGIYRDYDNGAQIWLYAPDDIKLAGIALIEAYKIFLHELGREIETCNIAKRPVAIARAKGLCGALMFDNNILHGYSNVGFDVGIFANPGDENDAINDLIQCLHFSLTWFTGDNEAGLTNKAISELITRSDAHIESLSPRRYTGLADALIEYVEGVTDADLQTIIEHKTLPIGANRKRWKGREADAHRFCRRFDLKIAEFNRCFDLSIKAGNAKGIVSELQGSVWDIISQYPK